MSLSIGGPSTPPLLVLGILPSDYSGKSGKSSKAHGHQTAARKTWLANIPADVTIRFVLPEETPPRRLLLARAGGDDLITLKTDTSFSCTCAESTRAWFAHALATWPSARFIGKAEDDIMVSLPALRFELSRLDASKPIWWGLMAWTGNGDEEHPRTGCWGGGFEDDPILSEKGIRGTLNKERSCPEGARPIAPSPTHEIDIRSAPLARSISACDYPTKWLTAMGGGKRCPNDCAAVQGLWLNKCVRYNVTLAHATWSKVHSNSFDNGWRPFAPPSNLSVVLDMNLGDKKLKQLANEQGVHAPWARASAVMAPSTSTAFPPLLYSYDPRRAFGSTHLLDALNPKIAALHHSTCRWGGCHPSRGDPPWPAEIVWPAWKASEPWPATSKEALGM